MRRMLAILVFATATLGAAPARADVPWWFNVGPNFTRVDGADRNCGGGQTGLAFGGRLMLRAQYTLVSFEQEDDGNDCDLGWWGDSDSSERAVMAGFASREGLFIAAGPARVHVHETEGGAWGADTGTRVELGFSSRLAHGRPVGYEIVLFRTENEVRDHGGLAVNWTFGNRRAVKPARGRPPRR